jgi:hypothetical protein
MKNYYEDKPIVPYRKTTVEMPAVVEYLKKAEVPPEVKRAAYIMFRFESGNGSKGLNDNYVGAQADSGRWPAKFDDVITGVVKKIENGTRKERLFLQFASFGAGLDFLLERVENRGLYVGGFERLITKKPVPDARRLAIAYKKSWVHGSNKYKPTEAEISTFLSVYRQAAKIFS